MRPGEGDVCILLADDYMTYFHFPPSSLARPARALFQSPSASCGIEKIRQVYVCVGVPECMRARVCARGYEPACV